MLVQPKVFSPKTAYVASLLKFFNQKIIEGVAKEEKFSNLLIGFLFPVFFGIFLTAGKYQTFKNNDGLRVVAACLGVQL